jgi:hypothetical protein
MDETNSKTVMPDNIVTKWMKYLDERGTWINVWIIIGNRRIFGLKFWLAECMDESNSKIIMTHGNYWTYLIFTC